MEMGLVALVLQSKSSEQKLLSQFHGQFIDLQSILFTGMSKERNRKDILSLSLARECIGKRMPLLVEYVLPHPFAVCFTFNASGYLVLFVEFVGS